MFDLSNGWTIEDEQIFNEIQNNNIIIIGNKKDLKTNDITFKDKHNEIPYIEISAKDGNEINKLNLMMTNKLNNLDDSDIEIYLNIRQRKALKDCKLHLEKLLNLIEDKYPIDIWSLEIRYSLDSLNSIIGNDFSEELLDNIFSKFCIGK